MSKTQLNTPVLVLEVPSASLYRLAGDARQSLALDKSLNVLQYPSLNSYAIQIDIFKYSLSPEIPFLRHGSQLFYTFPDVDTYFGLEFSPDTPIDTVEKFEEILIESAYFSISVYEIEEPQKLTPEEAKSTTGTISGYITSSAEFIKSAFIKTAEVTSKGVKRSGEYITSKVGKNPQPTKVGTKTKTAVHGAKVATDKAIEVKDRATDYVADKASGAITNYRKKQNTKENIKEPDNELIQVGKAALKAYATVAGGISEALGMVTQQSKKSAVGVVQHRYGEEAGKVFEEGLDVGGNIIKSPVPNMGMVKKVASSAVKKVAQDGGGAQ